MSDRPTDAELAILRVLWELGPSTVREVHSVLEQHQARALAYTTALKLLQVMHEKGLVVRDESQRSHIYTPTWSEDAIQGRLLGDVRRIPVEGCDNLLISFSNQGRIVELTREGEVVWDVTSGVNHVIARVTYLPDIYDFSGAAYPE